MKDLLINAQNEIVQLRKQNEILKAKVDVMELFACVLHTNPARMVQGQEIDVVWQIQQYLDKGDT